MEHQPRAPKSGTAEFWYFYDLFAGLANKKTLNESPINVKLLRILYIHDVYTMHINDIKETMVDTLSLNVLG